MESVSQKTAVITGCSSGIGKALAKKFHSEGYQVIAGARRLDKMNDLKEIGIVTVRLDITSDESVNQLRDQVEKLTGGSLDILINNAGQGYGLAALDTTVDRAKELFDVNYFGAIRMINAFAKPLIRAKGKIIQIGSITSKLMVPFGSSYAAVKAALLAYSDCLSMELKAFEVEVITIITGGVATDIYDPTPIPEDSLYKDAQDAVERRKRLSKESSPMSADDYATRVFNHVSKKNANTHYWEGTNAIAAKFATEWLPRWLVEYVMMKRQSADKFVTLTRAKRANGELHL
jgi:1-acylglycerone phosphate reductase